LNGRMEPPADREVLAGEMVREGDYWTVVFGGRQLRVRDSKGMGYLAELLSRPGTEISAVQLAAACSPRPVTARRAREDAAGLGVEGDLGPVLDARAKAQYRQRLAELRAEADEAEAFHDPERAARARAEYQLLAAELAAAVGLGGRDRRAGSPQERARLNVTRAIKASVRRLGRHDPALAAHLAVSVLTGRACVYRPEHAAPVRWRVLTRPPRQAAQAPRFEAPETHYAQAGEVSIAYQVLGEGERDIVFVPGVISHLDLLWEDVATSSFYRRLATLGRLIMFDKRDTGLSDSAHGDATLEERMDDLKAVMAACGCQRAALFGYSEGGPMSILFTATYPERVSALILGAAAARWPSAPDYPCGRSSDRMLAALEHIGSHHWGKGDCIEWYAPSLADSPHARKLFARYERMAASPSAFLRMLRMIREIDVRALLPAIHVPTLVIQRLDDRVTPRCHGRYLADHIPGSRYFEQPGDHSIRFEGSGDLDALFTEIEDFLASASHQPDPDRVLATILIADAAASPARAAGPAEDMHPAFPGAARRTVEARRGRVVHSTGQRVLATFDGPGRALRCATALRDTAQTLGIQIRIGIHTGEVENCGEGIAGTAVEIAANTAALARPSQILATRTVKDLVAGSGITFLEHSSRSLTGMADQWLLFAVGST
jgi:pimeloyl-ACP methyl ester carboxylesterase/class 3 adenylate cyclase